MKNYLLPNIITSGLKHYEEFGALPDYWKTLNFQEVITREIPIEDKRFGKYEVTETFAEAITEYMPYDMMKGLITKDWCEFQTARKENFFSALFARGRFKTYMHMQDLYFEEIKSGKDLQQYFTGLEALRVYESLEHVMSGYNYENLTTEDCQDFLKAYCDSAKYRLLTRDRIFKKSKNKNIAVKNWDSEKLLNSALSDFTVKSEETLYFAAKTRLKTIFEFFYERLDEKSDINLKTSDFFVKHGIKVDERKDYSRSVLEEAMLAGSTNIVEYLDKSGVLFPVDSTAGSSLQTMVMQGIFASFDSIYKNGYHSYNFKDPSKYEIKRSEEKIKACLSIMEILQAQQGNLIDSNSLDISYGLFQFSSKGKIENLKKVFPDIENCKMKSPIFYTDDSYNYADQAANYKLNKEQWDYMGNFLVSLRDESPVEFAVIVSDKYNKSIYNLPLKSIPKVNLSEEQKAEVFDTFISLFKFKGSKLGEEKIDIILEKMKMDFEIPSTNKNKTKFKI